MRRAPKRGAGSSGPFTTLHLTNAYHASSGGVRTFYHALLSAAERHGRRMHLVVPGERDRVERTGHAGRIHHVAAAPAPCIDTRYRLLRPASYLTASSPIARLLDRIRPDIVEVCDKYSLVLLARLLRRGWLVQGARPTVIGASAERFDDAVRTHVTDGRVGARLASWYVRYVYHASFDAHVANSPYSAEELRTGDHAARPVYVSTPGVSADVFGRASRDHGLRERLLRLAGGGRDDLLLLYAGRIAGEKHLDLLIDALAVLQRDGYPRTARLVLVGDGPDRERLLARAAAVAPSRTHMVGHLDSPAALATHYASADVFVHPNPHEPFGIGPLEAMAAGTPVVVSDRGGVRTYAHEGNAWLARPDGAAIAHAIRQAAAGRDESRLAAARRTAADYDWQAVAHRYFATLDLAHRRRMRRLDLSAAWPADAATG